MPENEGIYPLTPRQLAEKDALESMVEVFGPFDQSAGSEGSHYAPADANPFKEQGLVCSNCAFFEGPRACEIVSGDIDPNAVCKFWIIPTELVTASEVKEVTGTKVTYDGRILAADTKTRTLTGLVVPFEKVGHTSVGQVKFSQQAFRDFKESDIVLNMEHDRTKPIGRGIEGSSKVTPAGISMSFKVVNTTAGNDALVEAAEGLRPSFSIEALVNEYTQDKGTWNVTDATLEAVAHVTNPAFKDANILEVAASQTPDGETAPEENSEENTMNPEPQESADVVEEVTASAVIQASAPVAAARTAPRSPIVNAASYLQHSILAAGGNYDSQMYVRAADDSTSTNTGLTLPQHLQEFVTNTIGDRPAVDAVSRQALVSSGMTFTVPKLTAAPTVAATSEGSAPSETGMTSNYLTGTVVKYAGMNDVSWELIDRSSPEFYAELLVQLQNAYAKATDSAVLSVLASGGTQAATTAATAAGFISYVGTESAACFAGSAKKARNVVMNTAWWGTLLGATDSTGRPLFTASNAQNNPGVLAGQSIDGNIMGLNAYVDPYVAASTLVDDSAFIIAPEAVTWYEAPTTRLQVQMIETGQIRVGIYGYGCALVKQAEGIRRFNLT